MCTDNPTSATATQDSSADLSTCFPTMYVHTAVVAADTMAIPMPMMLKSAPVLINRPSTVGSPGAKVVS